MKLNFHTLDVFTTRRFGGNPLAVVLGADDLSTEQMQTITREFNLSETTFVMKPADPANTAKVRIFFPGGEMPFAGHPTVGTAILLGTLLKQNAVRLELKAGLTPVSISNGTATVIAPKIPSLSQGDVPKREDVARALDIAPEDIGFDSHALQLTRGAIGFLTVPVKSRAVLAKSRIIEPHWSNILKAASDLDAAYVYTRGGDAADTDFRARMYSPTGGIPEDPATGSATVQMAAQLLLAEKLKDGTHTWKFEQGYEMGRPSDLALAADVANSQLVEVRISGQAVQMMQGVLEF